MLRVLKQKANMMDGHDSSRQTTVSQEPSSDSRSPQTVTNLHKEQSPVVVSHVPISVGSSVSPSSTNSSISTEASTLCDQLGNGSDDMTGNIRGAAIRNHGCLSQDSSNESLLQNSAQVPESAINSSNMNIKRRTRPLPTIKTSREKETAGNASQEPPIKKPRMNDATASPNSQERSKSLVLLARDHDDVVLNPIHVFVRNQIEVFTATAAELALPAPGRKHPIKLNQVGLRCIHCRDVPSRKRVKRAVCYPSTVGKVYHSVSDMKFDHFSNCKNLPEDVRSKFESLKTQGKRTSDKKSSKNLSYASSTAQYYHDAAVQMGMKDGPGGIYMASGQCLSVTSAHPAVNLQTGATLVPSKQSESDPLNYPNELTLPVQAKLAMAPKQRRPPAISGAHVGTHILSKPLGRTGGSISPSGQVSISLSSPTDKDHLNQLHCFVRRNVELFTADEEDIAAPAPGRKHRVVLGQVGIRCIHCTKLPLKERVKRAVCYPPSVGGIYHSVSNMKFDHFAICRGLPTKEREEFATLKSTCARRGTAGNNASRGMASSTAQYYHDSALGLGLMDTPTGIRVSNVKAILGDKLSSIGDQRKPALTGMSALMMAASQAA